MNKLKIVFLLILFFLYAFDLFGQTKNNSVEELFSPQTVKSFGDHLFCEEDYLRAISEYREYLKHVNDDSTRFKIGLALSRMGRYNEASDNFKGLFFGTSLGHEARLENYKSLFLSENYDRFRSSVNIESYYSSKYSNEIEKLFQTYLLINQFNQIDSLDFINSFQDGEKEKMLEFYIRKKAPPYKSETTAGLLSALIPGLGKIYADEVGDGIASFLFTGVLTFLAINNFNNDHQFRGWLFTGLAAYFYAGNIYGSMAAVQNYNAGVQFRFDSDLNLYLNQKNYFCPSYNFDCK